jgi:transcriptional regulator with XRE-family HTH domain
MREFLEELKEQFSDEDYRYGYAESFLNSYIAAQIKILREQRALTQAELAEIIGTQQAGISRLENVNYTSWKTNTLTRLARAFGLRLRISFEEFGSLPDEVNEFGRASLERASFKDDPVFGTHESVEQEKLSALSNERRPVGKFTPNVTPETPAYDPSLYTLSPKGVTTPPFGNRITGQRLERLS